MKKNKLAFILAILAAIIALSNFIYKIVRFHKTDYGELLLVIVVCILVISISSQKGKQNSNPAKRS